VGDYSLTVRLNTYVLTELIGACSLDRDGAREVDRLSAGFVEDDSSGTCRSHGRQLFLKDS